MKLKRPFSVLVVIHDGHGNCLLLQRDDDLSFWQSVTGTIEEGEAPIDTAYREIKEEIGVDAHQLSPGILDCQYSNQFDIRKRWLHRYPKGTARNTEHVFTLEISQATNIQLTEHVDFLWLCKQDAIDKAWSNTNKEAIHMFVPERS